MSRRMIGEILVSQGTISEQQLREALQRQKQIGHRRVGELLLEMGHLSEDSLARALAEQFSLEYVEPSEGKADPALLALLPRALAEKEQALPLGRGEDGRVRVAMADPLNLSGINDLQFQLRGSIRVVVASPTRLQVAIDRAYGLESQAERVLRTALPVAELTAHPADGTLALDGEAIEGRLRAGGEQPYVDLLSLILLHAIGKDASDIHIEPQLDGLRVRLRIDGMLQEILRLPPWSTARLVSRIKVICQLDVADRRRPQDGKVSVTLTGRRIDLRVSVVPSQFGENVVIRVLDPAMLSTDLGKLGWSVECMADYYRMVVSPRGMVLCVGPTGSGKTTTLYSTIQRLRSESTAIVTVEDPIEYTVDGVVQFEVEPWEGMRFQDLITALLRQDPNIIVIGEIRDEETARAAARAATTGHLVLSSLHTAQTTSTLIRMLELGVTPHLLGDCLTGVVAQRLVRRVCQVCSLEAAPEAEEWARLGVPSRDLGGATRRVGPGCPACLHTGYRGRIGVFEVLPISTPLRGMIQARASEQSLWSQARAQGLRTMLDDALQKVADGITTLEEVARVVPVDPWLRQGSLSAAGRGWRPPPDTSPAAEEELEAAPAPAREPGERAAPEPSPERTRVLVVDDAEEILQLVRITLEDEHDVALARDGAEALEMIAAAPPHLVVLDVMMPEVGGYEVCRRIRADERTANLPVIILSARGEQAHIKQGLEAGADDYLPKPFDPEELLLRVRALLRRARR